MRQGCKTTRLGVQLLRLVGQLDFAVAVAVAGIFARMSQAPRFWRSAPEPAIISRVFQPITNDTI